MSPPAALRLEKVGKTYGKHRALIDVSLTFLPGRVAAVLGPNGAGKSTMLGVLSTLVTPTTGSLHLGEQRLTRATPARALIGYVGHDPGLYGDLSARENLRLFARLYGLPDVERRIDEMLARVGLADVRKDAAARTFSRGMQQRLSLARALVTEPAILLFDEPSAALDPRGAAWLTTEIETERSAGRLVVLVTHDLDAAAAVADQVVILRRGRLAVDRSPSTRTSASELRGLYEETTRG